MCECHVTQEKDVTERSRSLPGVRGVSDVGCERIHKEKKVQRVKISFTLQKRRRGWGERETPALRGSGALGFYWIRLD